MVKAFSVICLHQKMFSKLYYGTLFLIPDNETIVK